jgi:Arc/MetJ-type ribon-helix-helix transcriptional regulator
VDVTRTDATASSETDVVRIPRHLLEQVDGRLPHSEFETRDEYVAFVLREVLARVGPADDGETVDESEVRSRLESLGYLDS